MKRSTENDTSGVFVDTWGWLVLEDRKHPDHTRVLDLRRHAVEAGFVWITTDYVLDETITRLFARRPFDEAERFCAGLFEARRGGVLRVEPVDPSRFEAAWRLRVRYRDKPEISFTDLTTFAVMRELRVREVITGDAHFQQAGLGFRMLP